MADWNDGDGAYPYPFRGRANNLPESRLAARGTADLGTDAWARRGRRLNMRRGLSQLERNPDRDNRRVWPLVDSFGRPLAVLEQHSNRWDVNHPRTGERTYNDGTLDADQILVQGRGCMVDARQERRYALVAFQANDPTQRGGDIVPFRLRAFVDQRALPLRDRRGRPLRSALDSYDPGCGGSGLRTEAVRPVADPAFVNSERFLGEDGLARTYATYNSRRLYGGAIYLMVNTTGVHGGGIVRAVIQSADGFARADGFGYCDPNVAQGSAVARWSYGRVEGTRIWGWLAEHC